MNLALFAECVNSNSFRMAFGLWTAYLKDAFHIHVVSPRDRSFFYEGGGGGGWWDLGSTI